jgi:hypothetical protein
VMIYEPADYGGLVSSRMGGGGSSGPEMNLSPGRNRGAAQALKNDEGRSGPRFAFARMGNSYLAVHDQGTTVAAR